MSMTESQHYRCERSWPVTQPRMKTQIFRVVYRRIGTEKHQPQRERIKLQTLLAWTKGSITGRGRQWDRRDLRAKNVPYPCPCASVLLSAHFGPTQGIFPWVGSFLASLLVSNNSSVLVSRGHPPYPGQHHIPFISLLGRFP